jgi:2-amino-4-hydroxy-6-hydroxymethyldihydropteridine diphosphokinase
VIDAYIGLGSNIEPEKYTPMALQRLRQELDVVVVSSFYITSAVGTAVGQADFINGVVKVRTNLSSKQLKFDVLREIEYSLGRRKFMPKHAPRTMDLDLLIYGNEINKDLNIPEPDLLNRSFVYMPLFDIAPDLVVPGMSLPLRKFITQESSLEKWDPLFSSQFA